MNTNLSEAFLFASGTLGALFLLLVIALVRNGVDGLVRIWTFVGPLLGGLIGTVTTSYFAEARVDSVKAEAAGQVAMVARNVSVAIDDLQAENDQLRAVGPVGAVAGGYRLGGAENSITQPGGTGGARILLPAPYTPILGGESSDIAAPPVAAPQR